MLDAFIIEELKKREQRKHEDTRPTLEIPVDDEAPPDCEEDESEEDEDGDCRVIIIDYND
jgi:hypothetical protein